MIRSVDFFDAVNKRLALPVLSLTEAAMNALPEYSTTRPTGTTIGKRWRCDVLFRTPAERMGRMWVIGEYQEILGDTKNVRIAWFRPVWT